MKLTEQYAAKRAQAIAVIEELAPQSLHAPLSERLRPAIALRATRAEDENIAVGTSKFGGTPDVPAGFEWPMWQEVPINFMAQINLDEIAAFDVENVLPSSGVLSFFYYDLNPEEDDPLLVHGLEEEKGAWRVFHFTSPLERTEGPLGWKNESSIGSGRMTASLLVDLPQRPLEISDDWSNEQWQIHESLMERLAIEKPHLMLGYPVPHWWDARIDAARITGRGEAEDWVLLLQLNSDEELHWNWGDVGSLFYLVHRDDLKAGDFSRVWLGGQS